MSEEELDICTRFNNWMYVHFYTILLWLVVLIIGASVGFGGKWAHEFYNQTKGAQVYRAEDGHFYTWYPSSDEKVHYADCTCVNFTNDEEEEF